MVIGHRGELLTLTNLLFLPSQFLFSFYFMLRHA